MIEWLINLFKKKPEKKVGELLYNAIRTPDGTILISRNVHDYKTYVDSISGEEYMVDGGKSYLRRNINKVMYEELSVYTTTDHKEVRETVEWGTYGPDGDEPLMYVKIKDLDDNHIGLILKYPLSTNFKNILLKEQEYRS